ncbi:MAG: TolC family protein [Bacteroidaceae bacterium]|nr:TolC family protein [Bacteroidaceae bacterium]
MKKIKLLICAFVATLCCVPQLSAQKYLNNPLPEAWTADSLLSVVSPAEDSWWKAFGDTCLTALINEAVDNNYDLLAAAKRIKVAKSMYNSALAGYSPVISAGADWVNNQTSGNLTASSADPTLTRYLQADLSVSWEIDLFGKVYFRAKESKEQYNATQEEYNAAMIALCAQLASNYITLRTYQSQMQVAEHHLLSQLAILNITETRFNTGLASALDVAQAKTVYLNTRASLPQLDAAIDNQINVIAVLLGKYPAEIRNRLALPATQLDYMHIVNVGIPYDLLRRRPDIRQAEYNIAAQAAAVGIAVTDFLPSVSLNGSVGYASHDLDKFFDQGSLAFNITPSFRWTLFNGTQRIQAHNAAKAQMQATVDSYNSTVLLAVQEVESAMSSYKNSIKQLVFLRELVNQGQITLDLSIDLYKNGLVDFQTVLDAQRQALSYQNSLEETRGSSAKALVNLYQALGGGWSDNQ